MEVFNSEEKIFTKNGFMKRDYFYLEISDAEKYILNRKLFINLLFDTELEK